MQRIRNVQPKMRGESTNQTNPQMTQMLELVDKNIKKIIRVFHILKKLRHGIYFSIDPNGALAGIAQWIEHGAVNQRVTV